MSGHFYKNYCFFIILIIFFQAYAWAKEWHFPAPAYDNVWCDYAGYLEMDAAKGEPGDEIAFFNAGGEIKGRGVCSDSGTYLVHVYGGDGISENAVLNVRVWDISTDIEYHENSIILIPVDLGGSDQPSFIPPIWKYNCFFGLKIRVAAKGDISGDNQINLTDAVVALRILSGLPVDGICILQKASIVGEKIGIDDAVFILRKTAGVQ